MASSILSSSTSISSSLSSSSSLDSLRSSRALSSSSSSSSLSSSSMSSSLDSSNSSSSLSSSISSSFSSTNLVPLAARLGSRSVKVLVQTVLKNSNDVVTSWFPRRATRLSAQSFELLFTALKRGDYVVISSYDFSRFFHTHKCDGHFGEDILCGEFAKRHAVTWFDVSEEPYLLRSDMLKVDIEGYKEDGYRFYQCICSLRDLARDFIPKMTSDLSFYDPLE